MDQKKLLLMILCTFVTFTGCSTAADTYGNQSASPQEIVQTESGQDMEEQITKNNTAVYAGAENIAKMEMGACVDGEQTKLCEVKMPTNYLMASLYMDEAGQNQAMPETNGKILGDVIESNVLESCQEIPAAIALAAQGGIENTYKFTIVDADTVSVESEKQYAPEGLLIAEGSGYPAYIYKSSGLFDVVFVYQLCKDWTLMIENSGCLKDEDIELLGDEFYYLVIPAIRDVEQLTDFNNAVREQTVY